MSVTGRVPFGTKLVYGSGDILGGGALSIINFYYAIFLTDVVGISPAYAGFVLLIGQSWNAVWAPFMGRLSDRTRTRFGRRKPYLIGGSTLLLVATVAVWTVAPFADEFLRLVYATAAYLVYVTAVVMVMVPYLALLPEISPDYQERTSINGIRFGFSGAAVLLAALVPMWIVGRFPDPRTGYIVMALVFGTIFSLPWVGIALVVKERMPDASEATRGEGWLKSFLSPLKIRTFRHVVVMYLVATLSTDVQSTITAYYVTYHLGRPGELSMILGSIVIMTLIFLPIHTRIANRIGKHRAFALAAGLQVLTALSMGLLPAAAPWWAIYGIAMVGGMGGGRTMLVWTMFPDAIDVVELETNRRFEGSLGGLMAMLRKTASASTIFVVLQLLALSGYVSPGAGDPGVGFLHGPTQPAAVVTTIRIFIAGVPLVLLSIGVATAFRYRLDAATHRRVRDVLEARRARPTAEQGPGDEAEAARLRETLV